MKWLSRMRALARGFKDLAAPLRKLMIALIGGTVLLIGIAMIVLPGPAFVVIPAGLAILATEFAWAARACRRAQGMIAKVRGGKAGQALQ